jgi:hypothetical protein
MSTSRYLFLLPLLLAGACATASKRVDQGMRLEQSGRPAEAARRYADALRRDPSLTEARTRLQESGDRAIADYLGQAGVLPPGDAADQYVEADDLLRVASAVGVTLRTPDDYPRRRRAAFDAAIQDAMTVSSEASANGQWESAASRLSRAATRWEATDLQRASLNRARFDLHLRWAAMALRSDELRAAHARAQQAIDAVGPGAPEAPRAMDIQAEALRRGTIRVAVLPASVTSDQRARLPGELLGELNDDLALDRWRTPTLFIAMADPRDVLREARRRGLLSRVPTRTEARSVGEAMGADVAVMLVIDSVEVTEADVQETRTAARTRAGADTAYTLRSGRHRVRVRMSYNLVDVDGYQQPERFSVWGDGSVRFRQASYRGDVGTLVLNPVDRALFNVTEPRLGADQVRDLARELGAALERELNSTLGRRIR